MRRSVRGHPIGIRDILRNKRISRKRAPGERPYAKIIGPVIILIDELMNGSDFETIVSKMNDEYGIPHFDVEDDPADMRPDRKMVTYSIGRR